MLFTNNLCIPYRYSHRAILDQGESDAKTLGYLEFHRLQEPWQGVTRLREISKMRSNVLLLGTAVLELPYHGDKRCAAFGAGQCITCSTLPAAAKSGVWKVSGEGRFNGEAEFKGTASSRKFKLRALKKFRLSQLIRPSSSPAAAILSSRIYFWTYGISNLPAVMTARNRDLEAPATGAAYQQLGTQFTDQSQG
ncbi:hypothetical protein PAAG_12531 [Paracoccidioides lutzii Pb01]|uniref:Uncharacterized protein n=1 Tax=Paracoccidioides lutzii (strain ATCC MYA-826 / Pb01) TaxID=502779 RepID=A0A0A2UZY2_PARBA|nr:hypothetical protein PAAG_12531 [Paracoccidioides lutzii Pb01]KGQ00803.1 hypothetical protein PAAG_12531 [Paracoccidioides lutzii Pb01]